MEVRVDGVNNKAFKRVQDGGILHLKSDLC